ncbi:MAG TPA: hypothetical protein PLY93_04940, partial [Turneriella sp.]|nr:hypothetical protein [Turneriella sp.]
MKKAIPQNRDLACFTRNACKTGGKILFCGILSFFSTFGLSAQPAAVDTPMDFPAPGEGATIYKMPAADGALAKIRKKYFYLGEL